jgi:U32 family peptidase
VRRVFRAVLDQRIARGRSANRGQCAQACRLPYELLCDGELRDFGDQKYLLSPQDLAAFPLTEELIDAGIRSFKIEGRLKTPEYVANITRHYREAIDTVMAGLPVAFSKRQVQQMEQSFSRGFSPGWLQGCDHKMLVPATSSAKRGVLLGTIEEVLADRVVVQLEYSIQAGDGVVFDGDRAAGDEQGGRVFQVFRDRAALSEPVDTGTVELSFDRSHLDLSRLYVGQRVWKTDDPRLNQQLRRTFETADARRRVGLTLQVTSIAGQPLLVEGRSANGCVCHVESEEPLQVAQKHPVTEQIFNEQLSRLGGTVFELSELTSTISGGPMVPLSVLGKVRRLMIEQLQASLPSKSVRLANDSGLQRLRSQLPAREVTAAASMITILCRSLDQLKVCTTLAVDRLIADFADIREYREAVAMCRESGHALLLAPPRIQKAR